MSIDNIQLPAYLCQKMFTKSLIGTNKPAKSIKVLKETKIVGLGENKKNILFLINNADESYLPDDEMKLLSDLLSACKLSLTDIMLINFYNNKSANYQKLTEQFGSKKILIFGVTTSELQLPFTIPFFQIQQFREQLYLINPSFNEFLTNKDLKKQLWKCLKKLFLEN